MKELWSKAQTRNEIIERSGTKFNSATDMDLAMRDAENRLQSGGGLLGKGGISFSGITGNNKNNSSTTITADDDLNDISLGQDVSLIVNGTVTNLDIDGTTEGTESVELQVGLTANVNELESINVNAGTYNIGLNDDLLEDLAGSTGAVTFNDAEEIAIKLALTL